MGLVLTDSDDHHHDYHTSHPLSNKHYRLHIFLLLYVYLHHSVLEVPARHPPQVGISQHSVEVVNDLGQLGLQQGAIGRGVLDGGRRVVQQVRDQKQARHLLKRARSEDEQEGGKRSEKDGENEKWAYVE